MKLGRDLKSIPVGLAIGLWCGPLIATDKNPPAIDVFFSPAGGCTEAVVDALKGAKLAVLVQAYSFTSAPIARALVDAGKRGVNVQVILDSSQKAETYSSADFLAHGGIRCFIDSKHSIAHNKVMVIDGSTVITGSFNFTKAAEEQNAENLLVIQDAKLASRFANNWRSHEKHSVRYLGRRKRSRPWFWSRPFRE